MATKDETKETRYNVVMRGFTGKLTWDEGTSAVQEKLLFLNLDQREANAKKRALKEIEKPEGAWIEVVEVSG